MSNLRRMSDRPVVGVSNMTARPWRMMARCMAETPELSLTMVQAPSALSSRVLTRSLTVSLEALLGVPVGGRA